MNCIEKIKALFADIPGADWSTLHEAYARDTVFEDPVHKIDGLERLGSYFAKLNKNVQRGGFVFHADDRVDTRAYLTWTMDVTLLRPKKRVVLEGITVFTVENNRIAHHRDFFDMGALVYEHVPVLASAIRAIKKSMSKV